MTAGTFSHAYTCDPKDELANQKLMAYHSESLEQLKSCYIDYRFLKPIHDNYPQDYERILDFFPLAGLELFRRGETDGLLGQTKERA